MPNATHPDAPRGLAQPPQRLLVWMPTWLGDVVMATPALRALRQLWPDCQLSALTSKNLRPLLLDSPLVDRVLTLRHRDATRRASKHRGFHLVPRLRTGGFDAVVMLPNSFRVGLIAALAGIPTRVGYARDGRRWLLTHPANPPRERGKLVPVSARDYYLDLVAGLGADTSNRSLELHTRPEDDALAEARMSELAGGPLGDRPVVLLNPGANFGGSKMWFPDRYAATADRLIEQHGCVVAVNGGPGERPIINEVLAAAKHPLLDLPKRGMTLRLLKSIVKRATVMITNDTGPRHIAAALGTPVVTLFGPTDPRWSEIDFPGETQLRHDVPCGPCQEKICPLGTKECLKLIDVDEVVQATVPHLGMPAADDPPSTPAAARQGHPS